MKNSNSNLRPILPVGIVFLILSIIFYIFGNYILGTSFLPMGITFIVIALTDKSK